MDKLRNIFTYFARLQKCNVARLHHQRKFRKHAFRGLTRRRNRHPHIFLLSFERVDKHFAVLVSRREQSNAQLVLWFEKQFWRTSTYYSKQKRLTLFETIIANVTMFSHFKSLISVLGYEWNFRKTFWIDFLLWIFLLIPLTVFTYYVYEHPLFEWLKKFPGRNFKSQNLRSSVS